jgi:L-lactate dehydrogenase complex protein LldG
MSTSRSQILARLRAVAPSSEAASPLPPPPRDVEVFADAPVAGADLVALFRERFVALKGEFELARGLDAAAAALVRLLDGAGEGPVAAQPDELIESLRARHAGLRDRLAPGQGLDGDSPAFARFVAGVSAVEALVARSGSVLLRATSCGGRRLSVLPPLHIALARRCQVLPSLDEALARLGRHEHWSYAAIASGPSRTADIEKILVMGAHGPGRAAVVCIEEEER